MRASVQSLHEPSTNMVAGESGALRKALKQVDQVAATDSTVLLLGETGTGKELFASRIHEMSARRGRAMVRVNCAAIPDTLLESELFGREKGAFTGAIARQVGRFELADHSTIFLDEIGDMPMDVQVKLLRVLEERQVERLGSPAPIQLNTRIMAATHRDLEQRVADGRFREDLFYRLNVFPDPGAAAAGKRRRTSRCWSGSSSRSSRSRSADGSNPSPARTWRRCSGTRGRATFANSATSSSAR